MTEMNVQKMAEKLQKLYKPSPSTLICWKKAIKPIAYLDVHDVDDDVVMDYRIEGMDTLSEGTLKMRIGYLKALWKKGYRWKLIKGKKSENPWLEADDGLKEKDRDPDLLPWSFYKYYHEDPYFVCLWYTGMRIGELAGIYKENIRLDEEIPYFNLVHQANRSLKNDASVRKVPIHPACKSYVKDLYFSKARNPGQSWSETFKENLCLPFGTAAHSLRHSFTTRARIAGCDSSVLKRILGHARNERTDKYGKFPIEIMNRELLKLGDDRFVE
jgi:integrase